MLAGLLFVRFFHLVIERLPPLPVPEPSIIRAALDDQRNDGVPSDFLNAFCWGEKLDDDWIDLLDFIGRNISHGFLCRPISGRLFENLQRAFTEDKRRLGLMRLMAFAVTAGWTCDVDLSSLDLLRFTEPTMREAAIILILSQERWEVAYQPSKLAEYLTAWVRPLLDITS